MMPVFGTPIIELNLLQLRDHGIREVIVNLHHLPVQIIQHLKDGRIWDMKIRYSLEPTILGTAGGIKKNEDLLLEETFLVVNADTYRNMNLYGLLDHHRKQSSVITMLLKKNPDLAPERAVWLDDQGRVLSFLNTGQRESRRSFATDFLGVQVMEPDILSHIPPGQPWEIQQVYVRLLSSGFPIGGHLHAGYWMDLGTFEGYRRIHVDALEGACPLNIPGRLQDNGVWVADGVCLEPDAKIAPPVFIGAGTVVRRRARIGPHTVIGKRCTIERGAKVVRSILWDGVRIRAQGRIEDQLVGCGLECALC